MQALDPVGHPAGADLGDLRHGTQPGPVGQVAAMRLPVALGELAVGRSRADMSAIRPCDSRLEQAATARGQLR